MLQEGLPASLECPWRLSAANLQRRGQDQGAVWPRCRWARHGRIRPPRVVFKGNGQSHRMQDTLREYSNQVRARLRY